MVYAFYGLKRHVFELRLMYVYVWLLEYVTIISMQGTQL